MFFDFQFFEKHWCRFLMLKFGRLTRVSSNQVWAKQVFGLARPGVRPDVRPDIWPNGLARPTLGLARPNNSCQQQQL